MFDPEVAAGYQDADIEQAAMDAAGDAIARTQAQAEAQPYDPYTDPDDTYGAQAEHYGPWDDES